MPLFFRDFDSEKKAFVNPGDTVQRKDGFPSIAVSTFSGDIIEDYVKACNPPEIARLYTANGSLPVYQAEYKGEKIALFVSRVGAPACGRTALCPSIRQNIKVKKSLCSCRG